MTPAEWIALGAFAFAVFGAIYHQGQVIAGIQTQLAAMPNAVKTERRLTRIEVVLNAVADALNVSRPETHDDDDAA